MHTQSSKPPKTRSKFEQRNRKISIVNFCSSQAQCVLISTRKKSKLPHTRRKMSLNPARNTCLYVQGRMRLDNRRHFGLRNAASPHRGSGTRLRPAIHRSAGEVHSLLEGALAGRRWHAGRLSAATSTTTEAAGANAARGLGPGTAATAACGNGACGRGSARLYRGGKSRQPLRWNM